MPDTAKNYFWMPVVISLIGLVAQGAGTVWVAASAKASIEGRIYAIDQRLDSMEAARQDRVANNDRRLQNIEEHAKSTDAMLARLQDNAGTTATVLAQMQTTL